MQSDSRRNMRKQFFDEVERMYQVNKDPKDDVFYYHPNEDRIVLSHALFWSMTHALEKPFRHNKCFLLLRQYQGEMLTAYLTESDEYIELLRYCNILFNALPYQLGHDKREGKAVKASNRLIAIAVVASGYGGDMDEDLADELLDDMDFFFNKVCCRKIERMILHLNKLVEVIGNDIADFCKRIGIADNEGHLNYGGLMCFGRQTLGPSKNGLGKVPN